MAWLFGSLSWADEGSSGPPRQEAEEAVVISLSELRRGRQGAPVADEPDPAAWVAAKPLADLGPCRLPPLVLEALDAASGRAVVRVAGEDSRLVKAGSAITGTEAVVRAVGDDKLIVEGPAAEGGAKPVLWIYPPDEGERFSRVQCFRQPVAGSARPASEDAEGPLADG